MSFRLYDSARRQIVPFEPLRAGEASIYCCGPTVQSAPHLGHIRKEGKAYDWVPVEFGPLTQ